MFITISVGAWSVFMLKLERFPGLLPWRIRTCQAVAEAEKREELAL